MKTTFFTRPAFSGATQILVAAFVCVIFNSCSKHDKDDHPNKPSSYNAEVLDKWMTIQLRLMRNATGIPNQGFARHLAYTGVAALESLKPGLAEAATWSGRWNGLSGLPLAMGKKYYYPANVNAAMASINKAMFPNASPVDKAAIDSLEAALNQTFLTSQPASLVSVSSSFGKAVAAAIFSWAETDGYKQAANPYTPPTGAGLWVPTAPAFASAATPYWGANRTIIAGSIEGTTAQAPLTYSTSTGSPFYQMVKQVYDVSQTLTEDQKAMASFWRDVPGATTPGHWLSIVQQVVHQKGASLEKAALAYALTGAAINDGLICCFKSKYQYNLVRPITYIRDVMGHNSWVPYLTTPAHPEYVSAHSNLSTAAALVLAKLFGNTISFTDHTYDYLGYAPRSFGSFNAIAEEAGKSRLYAGIHYEPGIVAGFIQGRKVAANIFSHGSKY